jgi:hypothetical protein
MSLFLLLLIITIMTTTADNIAFEQPIPNVWPPWHHQCRPNSNHHKITLNAWQAMPLSLQRFVQHRFIDAHYNPLLNVVLRNHKHYKVLQYLSIIN